MLVEADHDLAQNKHQCGIDNKRQPKAVLAKIFHQAFKQLQDNKNVRRFVTVKLKASFSSLTAMILQVSQNSLTSPMPRTMTTKKISSLKKRSMTRLKNVKASNSRQSRDNFL